MIDKYDELIPISFRMNLHEFRNARRSLVDLGKTMNWTFNLQTWANPYYFAFRLLLDHLRVNPGPLEGLIPSGETIDFIFDDRTEKKFILAAWDEIVEQMADQITLPFGSTPRFENDQKFLPLQAADLWAWWVREWYEEDASPTLTKMGDLDFGSWRGKKRKKLVMSIEEDGIFDVLKGMVVQNIAEGNVDPIAASIEPLTIEIVFISQTKI